MAGRTFVTGDIHGDLAALLRIEEQLPALDAGDTLVFLGDYIDRGPHSAQVVEYVRSLPSRTSAKVVALRVNHHHRPLGDYDDAKGGDALVTEAVPPIVALPTTAGTGSEVGRSGVVTLAATVTWDILVANAAVARLVLGPMERPRPAFVRVPLDLTHPHAIALLASIVTMTPGTVSVALTPGAHSLLVHALDVQDPEGLVANIKARYEAPIKEILEC